MLKKIIDSLKADGFEVYPPAIKTGQCKRPYIVVKDNGSSKISDISSMYHYFLIMCYVPQDNYTDLPDYVKSVENSMKKLQPEIVSTNTISGSFYDTSVNAHMQSLQYSNVRKLSGIIR